MPDVPLLTLSLAVSPEGPTQGQPMAINYLVRNDGAARASVDADVFVYYKCEGQFGQSIVDEHHKLRLEAGEEHNGQLDLTAPAPSPCATWEAALWVSTPQIAFRVLAPFTIS